MRGNMARAVSSCRLCMLCPEFKNSLNYCMPLWPHRIWLCRVCMTFWPRSTASNAWQSERNQMYGMQCMVQGLGFDWAGRWIHWDAWFEIFGADTNHTEFGTVWKSTIHKCVYDMPQIVVPFLKTACLPTPYIHMNRAINPGVKFQRLLVFIQYCRTMSNSLETSSRSQNITISATWQNANLIEPFIITQLSPPCSNQLGGYWSNS